MQSSKRNAQISHPCITPTTSPTPWKNAQRRNSPAFVMLFSRLWLTLNVCTHQRKWWEWLFHKHSALLDYLNASHAGEQGYVKAKWVNRSHGKYLMDFIESASESLWDISYLRAVPPQMKAHVVVSAPSVESSSPLTPIPPHHHKLLTQCLTNPMPSFGIWHTHSQMSKQRGLNPLYWIKEVWK